MLLACPQSFISLLEQCVIDARQKDRNKGAGKSAEAPYDETSVALSQAVSVKEQRPPA